MQQHSQIVELKDRLVQALDEQYNVKNVHEVSRIISILERTPVTREDLERTRLGKHINEFRRKCTDKELAKRAKNLIKSWQAHTATSQVNKEQVANLVNLHSNSTTPNAALSSPFNVNSAISPQSLSSDSNYAFNSSYASNSGLDNGLNANGRTNSLAVTNNGNSHPALLRIRNQHTALTSPHERSKPSVSPSLSSSLPPSSGKSNSSFRPHSKTASPRESSINATSQVNGHLKPSHRNHSNLTSPVNAINSLSSQNGLSPGLRNSFKNILDKDGISPNAFRQRTTPPKPKNMPKGSSVINPDSAPSSRNCSPLAFNFSNDSRDSTSFSNYKNSYSNQDRFSTLDSNDEDSNSSVFSSLSTDGVTQSNSRSGVGKRNATRKRKMDTETDSLRENLNSIINSGGRRLQSTQELAQKFNIKLSSNIVNKSDSKHFTSLSASSSPHLVTSKDRSDSPAKRAKLHNGMYKNGFSHHDDENSLGDFESAILKNNKSLPASPALLSLRNNTSHSATTSPAVLSRQSYEDEDDEYDGSVYSKASSISKLGKSSTVPSPENNSISTDYHKTKNRTGANITEVDRTIMQIYAKLPQINPDDIELMKQVKFDTEDESVDEDVQSEVKLETIKEEEETLVKVEGDENEDEYELFEYNEEYEVEEDEQVEVTDDEQSDEEQHDEDQQMKSEPELDTNQDLTGADNISVHIPQTEALHYDESEQMTHRRHTMSDINNCDKSNAVDLGPDSQGGDLKSKSTAITGSACATDTGSMHEQVNGHSEQDTDNYCDDSNDAISSSTAMYPQVTDSTINDELQCEGGEPSFQDQLESIYPVEEYLSDIELLSYYPPSSPFFDQFPPVSGYPSSPIKPSNAAENFCSEKEDRHKSSNKPTSESPPTPPPLDESTYQSNASPMEETSVVVEDQSVTPPTPPPSNPQEQFTEPESDPVESEEVTKSFKVKRKRIKLVTKRVVKKKLRKCVARSKVKRTLVDRVCEQHWESVNGNFDKDGVWHDFDEMTSTYVLQGCDNDCLKAEENVLHILPYVNYTW